MARNRLPDAVVEQMKVGVFKTKSITLATTLMCSDYPGVRLFEVTVEEPWPTDRKPDRIFHLSVDDARVVAEALMTFRKTRPRGLPVGNTGEYDRHKKVLVDSMRQARSDAHRKLQQHA